MLARLRTLVAEQLQQSAAAAAVAAAASAAPPDAPQNAERDRAAASMALVKASKCGDLAAIAALVGGGADPNARVQKLAGERYETTALCAAAVGGQLEAVRLLLDHGAVPSLSDSYGTAPLMNAAMEGHTAVVLELLERGTALPAALDAVHPETGWTAYHFGCFNNQADSVVALLRAGCDKAIKDRAGMTGEQCASAKGQSEVLARLAAFEPAGRCSAPASSRLQPPSGVTDVLPPAPAVPMSTLPPPPLPHALVQLLVPAQPVPPATAPAEETPSRSTERNRKKRAQKKKTRARQRQQQGGGTAGPEQHVPPPASTPGMQCSDAATQLHVRSAPCSRGHPDRRTMTTPGGLQGPMESFGTVEVLAWLGSVPGLDGAC